MGTRIRWDTGAEVFYRDKPYVVVRCLGGNDYMIRLAGGTSKLAVDGSSLTKRIVEPEGDVELPENDGEVGEAKGEGLSLEDLRAAVKALNPKVPVDVLPEEALRGMLAKLSEPPADA